MPTATLTTKGQITIPKEVRKLFELNTGDRLSFRILENGRVYIEPENVELMSLRGSVQSNVRGVSIEEMQQTIRKAGSGQ